MINKKLEALGVDSFGSDSDGNDSNGGVIDIHIAPFSVFLRVVRKSS